MYRLAYVIYALMIASAGVTFVFLEDIETDYDLPAWGIGLISALAFISILITTLLFSPFGDRGYLVPLGVVGIVLTIIGNVWIGYASDLWSLCTSRALVGVGTGLFSVAARKALIGDNTADSGERIGTLLSAAVAGFIAGPGIGAWLGEWGGIETPYLVIAGLIGLGSIPALLWLSQTPIATSESVKTRSMIPLLRRPKVQGALACQTAIFFNIGVFDSTVDEYLTDLGLSNVGVGWVLVVIGAPLVILPTFAGRYVDRHPQPIRVLLLGAAMYVPIVLAMGIWAVLGAFIGLALFQTTSEAVMFPAAARVVVDETGANESALGQGLLDSGGQVAAAFAAFLAPVMYDRFGGPAGSFGMSAVFGAAMVSFAFLRLRPIPAPVPSEPAMFDTPQ